MFSPARSSKFTDLNKAQSRKFPNTACTSSPRDSTAKKKPYIRKPVPVSLSNSFQSLTFGSADSSTSVAETPQSNPLMIDISSCISPSSSLGVSQRELYAKPMSTKSTPRMEKQDSSKKLKNAAQRYSYSPRSFRNRTRNSIACWLEQAHQELEAIDAEIDKNAQVIEEINQLEAQTLEDVQLYFAKIKESIFYVHDKAKQEQERLHTYSCPTAELELGWHDHGVRIKSRLSKARSETRQEFSSLLQYIDRSINDVIKRRAVKCSTSIEDTISMDRLRIDTGQIDASSPHIENNESLPLSLSLSSHFSLHDGLGSDTSE